MPNSATLYIVAAPSGAGKTSLVNGLLASTRNIQASVSHTTRAPRPGEQEGQDYYFVSRETFIELIGQNTFLEYAEVFGEYYGTSRRAIDQRLQQGLDTILEIDWQGARQIRRQVPDTCSIFILPPSRQALYERLKNRGQDNEEAIARRTRAAAAEMAHCDEFDYLVFNDDFNESLAALQAIVSANRHRREVQLIKHKQRLAELLNSSP